MLLEHTRTENTHTQAHMWHCLLGNFYVSSSWHRKPWLCKEGSCSLVIGLVVCLSVVMCSGITAAILKRGGEKTDAAPSPLLLFLSSFFFFFFFLLWFISRPLWCRSTAEIAKRSNRANSVVRGNLDVLRPTSCVKWCVQMSWEGWLAGKIHYSETFRGEFDETTTKVV